MQRANNGINKYYASEINEYVIKIAKKIIQIQSS